MANPPWFTPVMLGLMLLGLFWVVTFYVTATNYPIPNIGYWNLGIGFGLMITGFHDDHALALTHDKSASQAALSGHTTRVIHRRYPQWG